MKNKALLERKKNLIIAGLAFLLSCTSFAFILIYANVRGKHILELTKKDKEIHLKDSLILKQNSDLKFIQENPIYQFYVENELTAFTDSL